jgi:hypothetical protein
MKITPKWDFVRGCFDTKDVKMLCIGKDSHGKVVLSIKESHSTLNYPIAEINLFSGGRYLDFKETYDEAVKLGDEIARRWNEAEEKL